MGMTADELNERLRGLGIAMNDDTKGELSNLMAPFRERGHGTNNDSVWSLISAMHAKATADGISVRYARDLVPYVPDMLHPIDEARQKAESEKAALMRDEAKLSHEEQVRIGNDRCRLEAVDLIAQARRDFPGNDRVRKAADALERALENPGLITLKWSMLRAAMGIGR